ncbi:ABC transporter ATP-binding protein [Listeria costaricensis]|uniref:ABC transporter ATP-binding protein n=1 Tax=Listeria costaricensis TaxID=2026604 RepID=UPI000C08045B|nr:ABC transporter ATP-binding protein [Listeria costaricensis]
MKPLIELQNVHFSRKKDFTLENINLIIPEGKITTLIGPNGSGKSTLLRLIMRLLKPDQGEIRLKSRPLADYSPKELAQEMTMLSQSPDGMLDVMTRDLVAYGRLPHKKWLDRIGEEDESVIDWALRVTNLTELAYRPLHTLSGGERQRAWLAMALAQKTPILLLDEPTTYLDIAHQLELLELLKKLNGEYGLTILLVLHDLNQAARYSDHIVTCADGRLVQSGTPHEVFTEALLKDIFHIRAELAEIGGKLRIEPVASTRFDNLD